MSSVTRTEVDASIRPEIRFEPDYLKTMNGYLKVALMVLFLINIIMINASRDSSGQAAFFNVIASLAFCFTTIMLVLYLFHVPEKFYTLPWLPIEIGGLCITSLLYFIASLMVILVRDGLHTATGVFGFVTTVIYFYSAYLKYKQFKNGIFAQGSITSRSTTTTTSHQNASAFPA